MDKAEERIKRLEEEIANQASIIALKELDNRKQPISDLVDIEKVIEDLECSFYVIKLLLREKQ